MTSTSARRATTTTDALLRDIRKDERSHSMAVTEMRSGAGATPPLRRRR